MSLTIPDHGNLPAFEQPSLTLEWAAQSFNEVKRTSYSYLKGDLGKFVLERHPDGDLIYKFRFLEIPRVIMRKSTETLNLLKNSYDQAIYAATVEITKTNPKRLLYPWAKDQAELEHRMDKLKVIPELRDVIRSHRPYYSQPREEQEVVRQLAELANRKHDVGIKFFVKPKIIEYRGLRLGSHGSFEGPSGDNHYAKGNELFLMKFSGDVNIPEISGSVDLVFDRLPENMPVGIDVGLNILLNHATTVLRSFMEVVVSIKDAQPNR